MKPAIEAPTLRESIAQLAAGLRACQVTSHPREMLPMLVSILPRHGVTPASAIIGTALTWGNAVALHDRYGAVTYRQLGQATGRLAAMWATQDWARKPRPTVALMAQDDRYFLAALGALSLVGARILLINPRLGSDHLGSILADADYVVCDDSVVDGLVAAGFGDTLCSISELGPLIRAWKGQAVPQRGPDSTLVMMSSGTTGAPHPIPIIRRVTAAGPAIALAGATAMTHGVATLVCPPLFHGYGLGCALLALVAGSPLIVSTAVREDIATMKKGAHAGRAEWGEAIYRAIIDHHVGVVFGVPAHLRALVAWLETHNPATDSAPALRRIVSGADGVDERTIREVTRYFGPVLRSYYGTTESGTITITTDAELAQSADCVGRPVLWSKVSVVDEDGRVLRRGQSGQVRLTGPLASVHDEGATSRRGGTLWYTTSDIGYIDDQGLLHVIGRKGDLVRSGGEFVSLRAVEQVLTSMDAVESAQATPVADAVYGSRIAVQVIGAPGVLPVPENVLKAEVRHRLGPHAVPVSVQWMAHQANR